MDSNMEQQLPPMPKPTAEHQWLQKLVGKWTFEGEALMAPDAPPEKMHGTESVRALGGLWTIGEGKHEMPGAPEGCSMDYLMLLGFDPQQGTFKGSFVASVMTHLWVYTNGTLEGNTLTLDADGPDMSPGAEPGKLAHYQDSIEFVSDDHRVLRSRMQGADGQWTQFMESHYRRK